MDRDDRRALLRHGAPRPGESWADLGCGDGAFTIPLAAELGPLGSVLAIDRDPRAIARLRHALVGEDGRTLARVDLHVGELEDLVELPPLVGALFANALHYLTDPATPLRAAANAIGVAQRGRVMVIEYDRRDPNPWVPYPIPADALSDLARTAGLPPFTVVARARSEFGGMMYVAISQLATGTGSHV